MAKEKKTTEDKKVMTEDLSWVLQKPRISEKAALGADKGVYTFVVDAKANKIQIKKAIKQAYKVEPVKVTVTNTKGKKVLRRNGIGYKSGFKKAMVYLKKGETIEVF